MTHTNTVWIVFTHPNTHFHTSLDPMPDQKMYSKGSELEVTAEEALTLCGAPHHVAEYREVRDTRVRLLALIDEAKAKVNAGVARAARRARGEDVPEDTYATVDIDLNDGDLAQQLATAHANNVAIAAENTALAEALDEANAKIETLEKVLEDKTNPAK